MKPGLSFILILCLNFAFFSCGSKDEEEVESQIHSAISDLTYGHCQRAIDTLNDLGYQPSNLRYLKTYAAAYSCRAGYSTSKFFADDIPLIGSLGGSILGSLTLFSTSSEMDQPNDARYRDIQTAMNALLYAGGIPLDAQPTISQRRLYFENDQLNDLHAQLFYLNFVQLGKFLYHYGSASSTGVKGSGGGNKCLLNYDMSIEYTIDGTPTSIGDILDNMTDDDCTSSDSGNPQLGSDSNNLNTERLCQGLTLFNNLVQLLPEVLASTTGSDLSAIDDISTDLTDALDEFSNATNSAAASMLSQTDCEATYSSSNNDEVQFFYALILESLFW